MNPDADTGTRAGREIFLLFPLLLVLLLLVNHVRLKPPPVKSASVAQNEFSAERALTRLEHLLTENQSHAVGTPENALVRQRIIEQLQEMNVNYVEQAAFTCRRSTRVSSIGCAQVNNILVQLPGKTEGPAVVLVAHYDSQGATPGASDDGTAVVTLLEVLRIAKDEALSINPVVFVFNEGEEFGLFGAKAALDHPYLKNVGVVLNFEARGTAGQSVMFETSEPNAWLIDAYKRVVSYPATTSLYFEIYKILPNDTDLTIFKQAGLAGMNFAYAENVAYYHTPFDNITNLNIASLQHHGENALAMTREFANLDFSEPHEGNAVYMDLLRFGTVSYPAAWAGPIAVILALVLFILLGESLKLGRMKMHALAWGVIAHVLLGTISIALGVTVTKLAVLLSGSVEPWWSNPLPMRIALWVSVYLACCLTAMVVTKRAGYWGLTYGNWSVFAVLGIGVGLTLPGVGILFVLPLATLVFVLLVLRFTALGAKTVVREVLLLLPVSMNVLLWTQIAEFMDHALGMRQTLFVVVPLFMAAIAVLPLFAINDQHLLRYFALGSLGMVFAGTLATGFLSPYSETFPQKVRLEYLEEPDEQQAWWLVTTRPQELPAAIAEQFDFPTQPERFFHSTFSTSYVMQADYIGLPAANFEILEDRIENGQRVVRGRFNSDGNSLRHRLLIPDEARPLAVSINGIRSEFLPDKPFNGQHLFSCATSVCNGMEAELRFASLEAFDFIYREQRLSIPETARPLQDARGVLGIPNEAGDASFVARTISLPSLQH